MNIKTTLLILIFLGLILVPFSCTTPDKKIAQTNDVEIETTTAIDVETYAKHGISEASIESVKAIPNGSPAPDFTAKDQNGNTLQLSELIKKGDVVLVFYRGNWCPICTKNLAEYADELQTIKSKGAQVIAIAPEGESYRDKTAKETKLEIPFISDSDNSIMKKYGVAFKVTDAYNEKVEKYKGQTLEIFNEQDEAYLPVPATYIIGKDGKVKWSHFDPNYRERASIADVIAQL